MAVGRAVFALVLLAVCVAAKPTRPLREAASCLSDCSNNGYCFNGTCLCQSGFSGTDCSQVVCPNDCSTHGICNHTSGVCECDPGFFGDACDLPGCMNNCSGNGYCHGQLCVCYNNFDGLWCQVNKGCPADCNGRGTCRDGVCYCADGFTGKSCDERVCPQNCNSRGKCNPNTGVCVCDNKFTGKGCELYHCKNDCSERGICNYTIGECMCLPGFYGPDCSPDNCPGTDAFGTACGGHGMCNKNETNATAGASCTCAPGYMGPGCEKEKCPGECSSSDGQGACTDTGCKCMEGYGGPDCARHGCLEDCNGADHGICDPSTWTCACNQGWGGDSCKIRTCKGNCNSRGLCINGTCSCQDWWRGKKCEIPKCVADEEGHPCYKNGICMLGDRPLSTYTPLQAKKAVESNSTLKATCKCVDGWGGKSCSLKKCQNDCSGRGICSAGVCFCNKGFYGEDCSVDADEIKNRKAVSEDLQALLACKDTCRNGKCLLTHVHQSTDPDSVTTVTVAGEQMVYQCLCEASWTGTNCDVKLDNCPPGCMDADGTCLKSCVNGALCPAFDGLTCGGRGECLKSGKCKCNEPYVGKACETTPCPLGCSKRGYCNSKTHKCLCPAGWSGAGCEHKLFDTAF